VVVTADLFQDQFKKRSEIRTAVFIFCCFGTGDSRPSSPFRVSHLRGAVLALVDRKVQFLGLDRHKRILGRCTASAMASASM